MANFRVHIKSDCTVHPTKVPPSGSTEKCRKGSTVTFTNDTGNSVTLNFVTPPGNPFGATPPVIVPAAGQTFTVDVDVTSPTTYSYTPSCSGTLALSGGGGGIIIVDPGTGGMPHPGKPGKEASARPAAKSPKGNPKAKPNAKPKAKPNGKGKAKGSTKAAPKRKAGKARTKK